MYIALKLNLTTNLITKTFLLNLKTLIYVSYNNPMLIIAHCYLHLVNYPPTLKRWDGLRASQQLAYCSKELEVLLSLHTCTRKSLTRF